MYILSVFLTGYIIIEFQSFKIIENEGTCEMPQCHSAPKPIIYDLLRHVQINPFKTPENCENEHKIISVSI